MTLDSDTYRPAGAQLRRAAWALFTPSNAKRIAAFLAGDALMIAGSWYLAYCVRFDFRVPPRYFEVFRLWLPWVVGLRVATLAALRLYTVSWRFTGLKDLVSIIKAVAFSTLILLAVNQLVLILWPAAFAPRGAVFIDAAFCMVLVGGFRISRRLATEAFVKLPHGKRVLIVGAGYTGERLAREMLRSAQDKLHPVAFVDDEETLKGERIHGIPVLCPCESIPKIVLENRIEAAIVTFPPQSYKRTNEVFRLLTDCGVHDIKVPPRIHQMGSSAVSVHQVGDIQLEDLLPRKSVCIDNAAIAELVQDKTVLVTGAGGSIGSELVRQLLEFGPKRVVALEIDETELHNLMVELQTDRLVPYLGDVRDAERLEDLFREHRPELVFHAAAYKHVPMMEWFPGEGVRTNVGATWRLASLCIKHGVRKFVNISTDKAVNPTSVMGATKRVAEMICSAHNGLDGTRYVSVRFGNVLGSRGSVLELFLRQIRNGGPVKVTHRDMQRYFMSIPEAVLLVCQAAAMGVGGEVFVLDMGDPVRIVSIAENLIRLHGLQPHKDMEIVFTGTRPGEKLFEEMLTAEEGTTATAYERIFVARNGRGCTLAGVEAIVAELMAASGDYDRLRLCLREHVPFFSEAPAAAAQATGEEPAALPAETVSDWSSTLAAEVRELLSRQADVHGVMAALPALLKQRTGIDAVAIRLQDGEDFPYYGTMGFSEEFVRVESCLCACDEAGVVRRGADGKAVLECMCGNVIRRNTNPALPFFTDGGSFWTNSTTDLLHSTTEPRIRNRCNAEGYESVALAPVCSNGDIIGLLQLNNRRGGVFTPPMIRCMEEMGRDLGAALRPNGGTHL